MSKGKRHGDCDNHDGQYLKNFEHRLRIARKKQEPDGSCQALLAVDRYALLPVQRHERIDVFAAARRDTAAPVPRNEISDRHSHTSFF
jgi:hypothetical protein